MKPASPGHSDLGRRGERDAVRFLKKNRFKILSRNFTCPAGELDIVALRDGVVSIVEVKAKQGLLSRPEEAVNQQKRRKLAQVAGYFLQTKNLTHLPCRFDVVAINYDEQGQAHLHHFPDAFEAV